jgi:hypothetical protein
MTNTLAMDQHFERNKNVKAATVTIFTCAAIFLLFFLLKFALPQLPPPEINEGIEVNLGDSETGLGDVQPLIAGDPAPATAASNAASAAAAQQNTNNETETNPDAVNPPTSTTKANTNNPPTNKPAKTVMPPTPEAPKAKAQMGKVKGGDGPGGNRQDGFDKNRNQGIAGGNGDQGDKNGNPNSDSYKGNSASGNGGIRMSDNLSSRGVSFVPKLNYDENVKGTVAITVTVDQSGTVIKAVKAQRGTTPTLDSKAIDFALQKVYSFKYKPSLTIDKGDIYIQFKY